MTDRSDLSAWASARRKMGLVALATLRREPENRPAAMITDLLEQIDALIDASTDDLDRIEHTLTDGYARAMSLESERWRLAQRMSAIAAEIEHGDLVASARELGTLTARLEENAGDLLQLRGRLSALRSLADEVRLAATR